MISTFFSYSFCAYTAVVNQQPNFKIYRKPVWKLSMYVQLSLSTLMVFLQAHGMSDTSETAQPNLLTHLLLFVILRNAMRPPDSPAACTDSISAHKRTKTNKGKPESTAFI